MFDDKCNNTDIKCVKYFYPEFISDFFNDENENNYCFKKSISEFIEFYSNKFNHIKAAGGIVFNEKKDKIILIKHYDKWDLPKGWVEADEKIKDAAIREVKEECGLVQSDIKILSESLETYHFYYYNNESTLNLKHTFWFLMQANETILSPQLQENISVAEWVNVSDLKDYFKNMYPGIVALLNNILLG